MLRSRTSRPPSSTSCSRTLPSGCSTTCRSSSFARRELAATLKEKACRDAQIVQTGLTNPFDRLELGIEKRIDDLMIERLAQDDAIVTRYMEDREFRNVAYTILAKAIYETIRSETGTRGTSSS